MNPHLVGLLLLLLVAVPSVLALGGSAVWYLTRYERRLQSEYEEAAEAAVKQARETMSLDPAELRKDMRRAASEALPPQRDQTPPRMERT